MKSFLLVCFCLLTSVSIFGQLSSYERWDPRFNVHGILKPYDQIKEFQSQALKWNRDFKGVYGPNWTIRIDLRGGRPGDVFGQGIRVLPGLGNSLSFDHEIGEAEVGAIAYDFLKANAALFSIGLDELSPVNVQAIDDFWHIGYQRLFKAVPVSGASFFITVSHGNIIAFGCSNWGDITISTTPAFKREDAQRMLFQEIGGTVSGSDTLLDPGSLFVWPINKNGDSEATYTGEVGQGYDHLLVWQIILERKGDGIWAALLDTSTNELLSFYPMSRNEAYKQASVTGNVYVYEAPMQAPIEKQNVGMPFADVRYHYSSGPNGPMSCYQTGSNKCWNSSDYCLPEIGACADPVPFETQYCAHSTGIFSHDDPLPASISSVGNIYYVDTNAPLQTRLFSKYIQIFQKLGPYSSVSNSCECLPEHNDLDPFTHLCKASDSTGTVAMGGVNLEDSCQWTDAGANLSTPPQGNTYSARSAYYNATMYKRKWLSAFDAHGRPLEPPDGEPCPSSNYPYGSLLWWLSNPLPIHISEVSPNGWCDQMYKCWPQKATSSLEFGTLYLCPDTAYVGTPNQIDNRNSGEVPGVLYHEMGHGIDKFDFGNQNLPGSVNDSSESYADFMAALTTHDSCIARGWFRGNTDGDAGNPDCHGDGNMPRDCTQCDGYRDLDWCNHRGSTNPCDPVAYPNDARIRKLSVCKASDTECPNRGYKGPCGKEAHTEGEVAGEALWDLAVSLTVGAGPTTREPDADAWQKVERWFVRATSKVSSDFYICTTLDYGKSGCDPNVLFRALWTTDDNDGSDSTPPPHKDELCKAFMLHEIGCDQPEFCGSSQAGMTCPAIAKPVLPPAQVYEAHSTVYLDWNAAVGALSYDVMRSDLGPLATYIRIGTTSTTEFMDTGLLNGQTYWYRIVPTGASRSCIGPLSDARQATPLAGKLIIFPQMQATWLLNSYQTRKLEAYGGSGSYTWAIVSGSLPVGSGLALNTVTGELYGAPIKKPLIDPPYYYTFIVQATDQETGGPIGTQQYTIKVDITAADLDFTPTFMPAARVCYAYPYCYNVPLSPSAGPAISGFNFSLKSGAGGLPPGLSLIKESGNWYIRGIPRSSGLGLHRFAIVLTATGPNNIQLTMERAFEMPVFTGEAKEMLVSQAEGPTSGGTRLRLYMNVLALSDNLGALFDLKNDDCTATSGVSLAAEDFQVFYTDAAHNCYMEIITPRAIEGCYDVRVRSFSNNVDLGKTENGYRFKTLAFTTNQGSQNISIINTTDQIPFQTKSTMAFISPGVPMGIAMSKGDKAGRELYVVDSNSGKLVIYDAANFTPMTEIELQTEIFPTWTASEVEVSEDGKTGYILHLTDHDFVCPAYPCESSGSISVVNLVNRELMDLDLNEFTTSANAPQGITRIEIPHEYGLLPLSSEDVYASKALDRYAIGDKWPGEYLFVSGVTLLERTDAPLYTCIPGSPCLGATIPVEREPAVIMVDLNPSIVTDMQNGIPILGINADYQKVVKKIEIGGTMGDDFGINQGLDFQLFNDGTTGQAHVYAISPSKNHMVVIDFATLSLLTDAGGNPLTLPTGLHPTDVKVQKGTLSASPLVEKTYALITNAGEDTISEIDTADLNPLITLPKIGLDACRIADHFPASIDTRSEGDYAFTANFNSASVSVVDLKTGACRSVGTDGTIPVGLNPLKIAVAPMYSLDGISAAIQSAVEYAAAADFTLPAKQPTLLRDWQAVAQVEETQASPQAVLSNVENFEKHLDKWVVKEELKSNLVQLSTLYRTAYTQDHPPAGGQ